MEQYTETSCFITLKDHKENFSSHPKCRLINPAKSNLGKVSKSILEKITSNVKVKTGAHLWKSTGDVITWFKSLKNLKKARFIKFDIQEFYPSITSDLLDRALDYASTMTNITDDERKIVKLSKESLLFNGERCWVKKSGASFDVTMGSLDGAETSEIIGVYLLGKIKKIIPQQQLGLYRDDGLAVINNTNAQKLDKLRKNLHELFKQEQLKITVDICKDSVDYLDVVLNLQDMSYKPYRKPNDTPSYINTKSNHPPNIIKQIPTMISTQLSNISSDEKCLNEATHDYNRALRDSGYSETVTYIPPNPIKKKRTRKRNVLWYNPPYSTNVSTNIGAKFFALLEKHFNRNNPLFKVINRNNVKLSYSCMPNVGRIIKAHNKSVLKQHARKEETPIKNCNCRIKNNCPLKGNCMIKSVIYQADLTTMNGNTYSYIGLTEHEFKKRWYAHQQSFKNSKYRLSTELSKLVWELKDNNIEHNINWKIITRSNSYKAGERFCNLCLTEKFHILKNPDSINKRSELTSKCRHLNKFLVRNCI